MTPGDRHTRRSWPAAPVALDDVSKPIIEQVQIHARAVGQKSLPAANHHRADDHHDLVDKASLDRLAGDVGTAAWEFFSTSAL